MWKPLAFSFLTEASALRGGRCLSCQFRHAATTLHSRQALRHYTSKNQKGNNGNSNGKKATTAAPSTRVQFKQNPSPTANPSSKPGDEDFVPPSLDRPIGTVIPPEEGQNTGIDKRTLGERRDDFVNYDKHLERRKELTRQVAKPYFREWSNMRYHEGKTFLSNLRLFKREKALYFPNLCGHTLASPKEPQNTTSLLRGKISVVSLFSSVWAERQVATFLGPKQNPGLYEALAAGGPAVQKVDINLEENPLKAGLIRMFMWSMRKKLPEEQHERYFLVRRGLTDGLKEAIGMMNSKVGYVYLLDENCRIRWAGSGPAEDAELDALNKGIQRLVEEKRIRMESDMPAEAWDSAAKTAESTQPRPRVVVKA
ncbi:hypothetical protein ASPZODRAFT_128191 [Penicilliopsis zonata CBS 506.65]|uniref:Uncharacterized protein n=1 Tax=Penicilliopsis zonata CBS 506.65 TaxID=1073090 RepID=A0A1L9SR32_9EURO|nr:hypothetical protein ASPZODRAFT_128191 [Penicilliopsis zonata CBS 506.65]OJJ49685.1 hypothetical protein ASPZODRAFT_128191 [Penicilliopsis zonata CBS 506.65]